MAHHGGHCRQRNFPGRRKARQEEAEKRNETWRSMSPEEQLASLDARGAAAAQQRARIAHAIASRDGAAAKESKKRRTPAV